MTTFEVCVDNAISLAACVAAGVRRVELCAALSVGGITPSAGLISVATQASIDVHVLIRPRAGGFNFNENELALMCHDIQFAADAGADGVVIGAANASGGLNLAAMRRLSDAAGCINKTLHRVIDTVDNPLEAMEQVIDLGFDTILTSGGKPCVSDGTQLLAKLHRQASGRIEILAGAGLTPSMVQPIYRQTGVQAFHSSCTKVDSRAYKANLIEFGFGASHSRCIDSALIKQFQAEIQKLNN